MGFWDAFNFAAFMTMAEEYENELEEQEEDYYDPPVPAQQSTYVPDPEYHNEYGVNKLRDIFRDLVDCANRVNNTSFTINEDIVSNFIASVIFHFADSADTTDEEKIKIFEYGLRRTYIAGQMEGEFLFGYPDKALRNSMMKVPKSMFNMVCRAATFGDSKFDAFDFVKCATDYFLFIVKQITNKFSYVKFEINIGMFITDQAMKSSADLMEELKPTVDAEANTEIETKTIKEIFEKGGDDLATIIGAGKYIFGEDIPLGKYTLKAVSGNGTLSFPQDDGEYWINLGVDDYSAKSFTGLSLEQGMYFTLDGNVEVEITKTKMIEIEE